MPPLMKRIQSLVLAAALSAPLMATAQNLNSAARSASADLQEALAELSALQQQIEAERLPVARQIASLEQQLAEGRAACAKAQRAQENQLVDLNALKTEAKRQSDEVKYVESLLAEYARALRSRLNFVEEPRYAPAFDAADKAAASADLSLMEKLAQRAALLTASLKRTEGLLGGEIFDGKALDKQGRLLDGKVAVIGPVAMFASASDEAAGLLQLELNKADPTIVSVDEKVDAASRALVTSGTGQLALDATLGNAFKLAALKESLHEKLAEGGLVMLPLLGLGLASLLVALVKWIQLARIRLATERDLQQVLRHIENDEKPAALAHARNIPGVAGDLLSAAVEHAGEKKEHIEEVLYEKMLGARVRLERGIPFLALTATVGPLLGLLGTVTGMIATFKLISSFGSGDPKLLAAGISEALVATATGMAVAIPALLLHAFLSRKAKGILGSMEQTAVGFINGVHEEERPAFA